MEGSNFEKLNNPDFKKDTELEKLLLEANEGVVPDEYKMEDENVEFEKTKSGVVENIILKAQDMLRDDISEMLSDEDKKIMEGVVYEISDIKRRSAGDLWVSEVGRLMKDGKDVDNFKELASSNLYKEMKKEVLKKLGINEPSN